MSNDFGFIKIQPSNGIIKDKQGRTIALVWIFRPDTDIEDRCWFKACDNIVNPHYLCVEIGSDQFPINCKMVFQNSDGPNEWEPIGDEKILECFKFCCGLLAQKNKDSEVQRIGDEILNDMLSGDIE